MGPEPAYDHGAVGIRRGAIASPVATALAGSGKVVQSQIRLAVFPHHGAMEERRMGAVTKIEWCDHTFNPWWGCTQVSPLCDRCYAMMLDIRWHRREHWGVRAPRRTFDDAHWRQPLRWNAAAQA